MRLRLHRVLVLLLCLCLWDPVPVSGHVVHTNPPTWDPRGYVLFRLSPRGIGAQTEQMLSTMDFAKNLNRTLVLPNFYHIGKVLKLKFSHIFKVKKMAEFIKVIEFDDFMENLAPEHWPMKERVIVSLSSAELTSQASSALWRVIGQRGQWNQDRVVKVTFPFDDWSQWKKEFPPEVLPVLVLGHAPGKFPVDPKHRHLQKYFEFRDGIANYADKFIHENFPWEKFVGIHLRNAEQWRKMCHDKPQAPIKYASSQCTEGTDLQVTQEMCHPSEKQILRQVEEVVKETEATVIYVATDQYSFKKEIEEHMMKQKLKVKVFHMDPEMILHDLYILTKAHHVIGNCVSFFTAFVKRHRDVYGLPISFWGLNPVAATANPDYTQPPRFTWDPNGYLLFRLSMGRFGNQAEQLLGSMDFAKNLNRTLVLPNFQNIGKFKKLRFSSIFKLEKIQEYVKVIEVDDFMEDLAPQHWSTQDRVIVYQSPKDVITHDFAAVWEIMGIGLLDKDKVRKVTFPFDDWSQWKKEFPPEVLPVLVLKNAPGKFPVDPKHRHLQKYLEFREGITKIGNKFIQENFPGEMFVGIHLRNEEGWKKMCQDLLPPDKPQIPSFFASPQCTEGTNLQVTLEMCHPSEKQILRQVEEVVKETEATAIFVATDQYSFKKEIEEHLIKQQLEVRVFHMDPELPVHDIYVLTKADHFIGNCVSSFSAFVKRHRDILRHPTSFWGVNPVNASADPDPTTADPDPASTDPDKTSADPDPTTADPVPTTADQVPVSADPDPTTADPDQTSADPDTNSADSDSNSADPDPSANPDLASADMDQSQTAQFTWDPNGYLLYRLALGRFGNQAEQLLGSMMFAKTLNRTMVLPRFVINKQDFRFDQVFKTEKIKEFLKVIDTEDFMEHLAPHHWPTKDRVILNQSRNNAIGPEFAAVWKIMGHGLLDEDKVVPVTSPFHDWSQWKKEFPPEVLPVMVLAHAPGFFPVRSEDRYLQQYLEFSEGITSFGDKFIQENFPGKKFVGIHLRNEIPWKQMCESLPAGRPNLYASRQCTEGTDLQVTQKMCHPSEKQILWQVEEVVRETEATVIFVATDQFPLKDEITEYMIKQKLEVKVFHMDPVNPLHDLYVLTQADHFIGNCISSFSAFVKRHRDVQGNPSSFWGLNPVPASPNPDPTSADPDPNSADPDPASHDPDPASHDPDPNSADPDPNSADPDPNSADSDPNSADSDPNSADPDPNSADPEPASTDAHTQAPQFTWDPHGYVLFRLLGGRFGGQAEHVLGSMMFAKKLNRTLVLPKIRTGGKDFNFSSVFKFEKISEFWKVIEFDDFMENLAPQHWAKEKRKMVTPHEFRFEKPQQRFNDMWKIIGIGEMRRKSVIQVSYLPTEYAQWEERFPATKTPVLALTDAPADFPVLAEHRHLHKYLEFNDEISKVGDKYIKENFQGERFLGLHLRNAKEWLDNCKHCLNTESERSNIMASPQCTEGTNKKISMDICYPPEKDVLKQVKNVVQDTKVNVIFVATDQYPLKEQLEEYLMELKVKVYHMNPELPLHDIYVLTKADHFVGNCVSSFTAFVKRHRDIQGLPTLFWGFSTVPASVDPVPTTADQDPATTDLDSASANPDHTQLTQSTWDPSGYVLFRLTAGRFGNQMEQFLGCIEFTKQLNRTMVLPKVWINNENHHFTRVFKMEKIAEYIRVIEFDDFMENLAPHHWPKKKRTMVSLYEYRFEKPQNRFIDLWKIIGIGEMGKKSARQVSYSQDEYSQWREQFTPEVTPVLAITDAPGKFPVLSQDRHLQKYLEFSEGISRFADKYIEENFPGEKFLGLHLRNGRDWWDTCKYYLNTDTPERNFFFASPQCTDGTNNKINMAICYPTEEEVLEQVKKVVEETKVKVIFIATDKYPLKQQLEEYLKELKVKVYHMDPEFPLHDIYALTQADYFIGNCVSSFTAFIKRHRDIQGRPSSFWGLI